jgi:hypothetical protein
MGNSGSPLHIQTKDSHSPVPLLLVISTCQLLTRGAREDLLSPEEAAAPPRANALRTRMDPLSAAKQERVVIVDRGSPTEHCVFDCKQWKRKGTALTVGVNGKPAWETEIHVLSRYALLPQASFGASPLGQVASGWGRLL